jgi:hypothetical protein
MRTTNWDVKPCGLVDRYISTTLHGVTSQKAVLLAGIAVRVSESQLENRAWGENMDLRERERESESKGEKAGQSHMMENFTLCTLPRIALLGRPTWMWHVARIRDIRNKYKILF